MTDSSAKMPGGITGKGFTKGDPRINRKGRPKSVKAFRDLCESILAEVARRPNPKDKDKTELMKIRVPLVRNGQPVLDAQGEPVFVEHYATNYEMVLRAMMMDPKQRTMLFERLFGKVPDSVDVTSKGQSIGVRTIEVIKDYGNSAPATDDSQPGEAINQTTPGADESLG